VQQAGPPDSGQGNILSEALRAILENEALRGTVSRIESTLFGIIPFTGETPWSPLPLLRLASILFTVGLALCYRWRKGKN